MVTGLYYNNVLSKIQFWLFFIGANVTFAPMHFLGKLFHAQVKLHYMLETPKVLFTHIDILIKN